VEERIGPMRWSGVNPFLPLCDPGGLSSDRGQSATICRHLSRLWRIEKFEDMMNFFSCVSLEADKTYKQLESEDNLPDPSSYFFRFPLTSKTDPETLRRVMIVLKTILEHGCLDGADFKALMHNLLKIQEEGARKHDHNVWCVLLFAMGLHVEIPLWAAKIDTMERACREEQLCLPEEAHDRNRSRIAQKLHIDRLFGHRSDSIDGKSARKEDQTLFDFEEARLYHFREVDFFGLHEIRAEDSSTCR
jgi:hypothetical protein